MTFHLANIIRVARAGNSAQAWRMFVDAGFVTDSSNPQALTLKGRLIKDRAKASSGKERENLLAQAAVAYETAAQIAPGSYPLINAATLSFLAGEKDKARQLAAQVLSMLDGNPDEAETPYWRAATLSEALLLLDREDEAQAALSNAITKAPRAFEDHAATLGQFALIAAEQESDAGWLDQYRPPGSLHFSGIIGLNFEDAGLQTQINAVLDDEKPGFAFGALAAGADILIADTLMNRGVQLHVILPFDVDRFRDISVAPFGQYWCDRYDILLARAKTVSILPTPVDEDRSLPAAVDLANQFAMGQAIRNAANVQSHVSALTITGSGEAICRQSAAWKKSGLDIHIIETKRISGPTGSTAVDQSEALQALLWIENVETDILDLCNGQRVDIQRHGESHYCLMDDLKQAYLFAKKLLLDSGSNPRLALIFDQVQTPEISESLCKKMADIANISDAESIHTNHCTAMALTLTVSGIDVQEIGELKANWGICPIWNAI